MKRMLCLWLPNWPIQRLVVARPELEGSLVIQTRTGHRGDYVVACSEQARAAGIRPGMPLAEAASLGRSMSGAAQSAGKRSRKNADKCAVPDVAQGAAPAVAGNSPRAESNGEAANAEAADRETGKGGTRCRAWCHAACDPDADRAELLQLAEVCEEFGTRVGLEESAEADLFPSVHAGNLWLDVTGLGCWFGSEKRLVEQLLAAVHDRGYRARAALADTFGTAWAMAHFGLNLPEENREQEERSGQEKVCSCPAVFSFRIVSLGESLAALRPLPVEALRLAEPARSLLRELGVQQIGDLLRLPRASLSARFGQSVLVRLDQASGAAEEVLIAHRPPVEFAAQRSWEYPSASQFVVEAGVREVLEELARQLMAQERLGLQLQLRFECVSSAGVEPVDCGVNLFRPAADAAHWLGLVRLQLEKLRLPGPVRQVSARIAWTVGRHRRQRDLWESDEHVQQRELARLVDRLSSRMGSGVVLRPLLLPEAQPEHACRWVPALDAEAKAVSFPTGASSAGMTTGSVQSFGPGQRPLRFYDPPHPIRVFAVAPDGPPVRFRHQQDWHQVRRAWGPERIETGWWRGRSIRRDYYRVESTSGHRFWLFRQLEDGCWFLQGLFE